MIAPLEQVFPLLKLLSSELAAKDGPTAGVHSISEVLAGDADALTFPVLQLPLVDVVPLVHPLAADSTGVLIAGGRAGLLNRITHPLIR